MIDRRHGWNESFKPLILGYTISIILTFAAYRILTHHHLRNSLLVWTLLGLCALQALFQFIFFLELGLGSKPHWRTITFLFMLLVVGIIVGGSLWIMHNLDYNVMPGM